MTLFQFNQSVLRPILPQLSGYPVNRLRDLGSVSVGGGSPDNARQTGKQQVVAGDQLPEDLTAQFAVVTAIPVDGPVTAPVDRLDVQIGIALPGNADRLFEILTQFRNLAGVAPIGA